MAIESPKYKVVSKEDRFETGSGNPLLGVPKKETC